jgi:hypothetical protein
VGLGSPRKFARAVSQTAKDANNVAQALIGAVVLVVTGVTWWRYGASWGVVAALALVVVLFVLTGLRLQGQVDGLAVPNAATSSFNPADYVPTLNGRLVPRAGYEAAEADREARKHGEVLTAVRVYMTNGDTLKAVAPDAGPAWLSRAKSWCQLAGSMLDPVPLALAADASHGDVLDRIDSVMDGLREIWEKRTTDDSSRNDALRDHLAELNQNLVAIRKRPIADTNEARRDLLQDGKDRLAEVADWIGINRSPADREIFLHEVGDIDVARNDMLGYIHFTETMEQASANLIDLLKRDG